MERQLKFEMGHEQGQIRSIAQFSPADHILIVTTRELGELPRSALPDTGLDKLKVHYVLETKRAIRKATDPGEIVESEANALVDIALQCSATPEDFLVIPSASPHDLRVAIRLSEFNGPRIVARIISMSILNNLTKDEHRALRVCLTEGRIHLSCETEEMSEAIQEKFDLRCPADFVLPCSVLPSDTTPQKVLGPSFRVGVLGGPRIEKGSYRLTSIIRALAAQLRMMPHAPKITFVVQTRKKLHRLTISLLFAKLTNRNPNVEIIWGAQSGDEFRNSLFGLDCVLLPYTLERYASSGSGMIIDAVNACVPIIRTRGMAMSKCMYYGNGLEATSDEEFAAAILRMAANPEPFITAAKRAHEAMQARVSDLPFV